MHADNFIINHGTAGQTIEGIAKLFPHFDGKSTSTFIVKAIDSINAGTFVIASEQEEIFGILNLVGKEQAHHLERLFAAIDIVSQE